MIMKTLLTTILATSAFTLGAYAGSGCCSSATADYAKDKAEPAAVVAQGKSCGTGSYASKDAKKADAAALYVVKMHSDYCGTCKATKDEYAKLKEQFKDADVQFLTMDYTNSKTQKASMKHAEKKGIHKALKDQRGMGYVLIIDGKSKEIVDKLEGVKEYEAYASALQQHLDKASERVAAIQ